jgi:single-strand DNA-binding protein
VSLNLNRVLLAGNLTRDPQVKFVANEKAVANFGLAINRRHKGTDGQQVEETTFVDVECWGREAEIVGQYFQRGTPIFLEGRLKLDLWDDKETGKKQSRLRIVAERIQFVEGKKGEPGDRPSPEPVDEQPRRHVPRPAAGGPDGDDGLPFSRSELEHLP